MVQNFSPMQAFRTYASMWIFNFIMALFAALAANAAHGVPLPQVVNALLSITLFTTYLALAIYALIVVLLVISGQFGMAVGVLFAGLFVALLPFAPVSAFSHYAWLGKLSISESFVYNDFVALVTAVARPFGTLAQSLTRPTSPMSATELWELAKNVASVGGFLLAMLSYVAPRRRAEAI
ncbi:MAG: hypothetical protein ACLPKB_27165 [Xanthobacteraceae bacterium]